MEKHPERFQTWPRTSYGLDSTAMLLAPVTLPPSLPNPVITSFSWTLSGLWRLPEAPWSYLGPCCWEVVARVAPPPWTPCPTDCPTAFRCCKVSATSTTSSSPSTTALACPIEAFEAAGEDATKTSRGRGSAKEGEDDVAVPPPLLPSPDLSSSMMTGNASRPKPAAA
jgi:hypothetical protein